MATVKITPDEDAIISEVDIAAPPARVFQALIQRAQALEWGQSEDYVIDAWDFDARPGGKWRSLTREKHPKEGRQPALYEHWGEVIEIKPPGLLVYTWFAAWHERPDAPTTVRWDLTATSAGTHLKLTHSGLAAEPKGRAGYSGGWPGILDAVKQYVER